MTAADLLEHRVTASEKATAEQTAIVRSLEREVDRLKIEAAAFIGAVAKLEGELKARDEFSRRSIAKLHERLDEELAKRAPAADLTALRIEFTRIAEEELRELNRWNDERLDDLHQRVNENTRKFEEFLSLRSDLVDLRAHVLGAEKIATDAYLALNALQSKLEARQDAQQIERKADRRWMVGTFLVSAGLIVAAVRLFIGG
jgi:hypothetical protein